MKPLKWTGTSREAVLEFSDLARQRAGYQLYRVQAGLEPFDWKPMAGVGSGVREIRIRAEGEFRVIYIAVFDEAVYVLHAFQKKTRKTAKTDIDLAKKRFKELIKARREKKQ